jgi:hypothetical protein
MLGRLNDMTASTLAGVLLLVVASSAHAQQFRLQTSRLPTQSFYSNQLSPCDIDGDNDIDFVVADGQGYSSRGAALKPRIYINDGSGRFTDETDLRISGVTGWFRGVEFGDCDRDGDMDMILAQDFHERPLLLINDGLGFFTDETVDRLPDIELSSARAQFGDVNGDGHLDLAFCDSGTSSRFGSNGRSRIFINDGTGHYVDETDARFIGGSTAGEQMDILFFDADNDLDLDLHVGTRASGTNGSSRLWINDGQGRFESQLTAGNDYSSYSYDAGDIDGDALLDLVGANAASGNREKLLRNQGDGSWADVTSWVTPNPSADDNDSKFLDLDDDGDFDMVIATLYGSRERIYVNDGTGRFTEDTSLITAVSDASLDIAVADFSGDGKLDIITVQGEGGNFQNQFYLNTGPVDSHPPRVRAQTIREYADGGASLLARIEDGYTSDRGFDPGFVQVAIESGGVLLEEIPMYWVGNSIWRAELTAPGCGGLLDCRVIVSDRVGNIGFGDVIAHDFGVPEIPGDVNSDGIVDGEDLSIVLGYWGVCPSDLDCAADISGDGLVDGQDITVVLGYWGQCS